MLSINFQIFTKNPKRFPSSFLLAGIFRHKRNRSSPPHAEVPTFSHFHLAKLYTLSKNFSVLFSDNPKFSEPISNVTAPVGREATLICVVDDIGGYKVSVQNNFINLLYFKSWIGPGPFVVTIQNSGSNTPNGQSHMGKLISDLKQKQSAVTFFNALLIEFSHCKLFYPTKTIVSTPLSETIPILLMTIEIKTAPAFEDINRFSIHPTQPN